jgi:predicted phosphodiesterase
VWHNGAMRSTRGKWLAGVLTLLVLMGAVALHSSAQSSNSFHFSILGDRTGTAAPQVYGRVWREIDMLHPDFVINVGDSIQGGGDDVIEKQWRDLRLFWERYKRYPLYLIPGNHDVASEAGKRAFEKYSGHPVCYGFTYQNAHFTVLDNSRTTELSEQQLAFLEKDLKENQSCRPKFVFFHKPYWLFLVALGAKDFPLHRLAKKYGVDYVVSGHGHRFVRMPFDGVVYLEVGSSGGNIENKLDSGEGFSDGVFYHHVWAAVSGSSVSMTVKELDGMRGRGRMFRAEDWDAKGPRFDTADPALTDKPTT